MISDDLSFFGKDRLDNDQKKEVKPRPKPREIVPLYDDQQLLGVPLLAA
ncbi:20600_t:CDS:2 [Entrophospora sp. SA101]|nr:20600_t:CDS:2 [Entrophospora sp. SA101]